MKKVFQKNYIILAVLIITTVFITLLLANIYTAKNKLVSSFYEYSNKITPQEFDEFVLESPDAIVYISDKYDLTNETFEQNFQEKINNLNIKESLVFIDTNEITGEFLEKLNKIYGTKIDIDKSPIILVVMNNKISEILYVENNFDVDSIINYEVFK